MNINEVYTLNDNVWGFYQGFSHPYLGIQTGGDGWFLTDDKITESSYLFTPQQLSEYLFNWVKE